MGLSEKEIMQLARLKKDGGKKLAVLRKERKKLADALARIDGQIAGLGGSPLGDDAPAKRTRSAKKAVPEKRRTRKAAVKAASKPAGKAASKPRRGKAGKIGLTEGVRKALSQANDPLRASDIVDALPGLGYKVKDVAATRKRVSIVLATQKNNFTQVARGLYKAVE